MNNWEERKSYRKESGETSSGYITRPVIESKNASEYTSRSEYNRIPRNPSGIQLQPNFDCYLPDVPKYAHDGVAPHGPCVGSGLEETVLMAASISA